MKIKRTERGWAGHFICADRCLFRRNTLLQYGRKFVVISTVGAMQPLEIDGFKRSGDIDGFASIGYDRYYETMAFLSNPNDDIYHDIDVSRQVYPTDDVKWGISGREVEENRDTIDLIANKMHEDFVSSIEEMLLSKEL